MNAANIIWLGVGVGFGLLASEWLLRSRRRRPRGPMLPISEPPDLSGTGTPSNALPAAATLPPVSQTHLQQLELAYQMAKEMEQFKAGFLARISHELRSPLNGLIGIHQLILTDLCDSPEEEREFLTQANEAAMRMIKMLDDILDVSKAEYGAQKPVLKPISLADLLDEVYALTYLLAQDRNLALQVIPPEPDIHVLADERRLVQVLVNFINTAILQMQEAGISVWAELEPNSKRAVIQLEAPVPMEVFNEPIDHLRQPVILPDFGGLSPDQQKQQAVADLTVATLPAPGLTLLVNQIIMETMGGQLELSPHPVDARLCQIRCLLPLADPAILSAG